MTDRQFDPTADAQANYVHALAMMRLRAVITGERFATEHDEFDLVAAASLARLIERQKAPVVVADTPEKRAAVWEWLHRNRAAAIIERQRDVTA